VAAAPFSLCGRFSSSGKRADLSEDVALILGFHVARLLGFCAHLFFQGISSRPHSLETPRNGVHAHVKDAACSDITSFQNVGK